MHIDLFDYDLPPHLIAQHPAPERDQSRLLVLRRGGPVAAHRVFADLHELLAPGDLLILNDTRVVPARLLGHRSATGGKWEGLFLRETPEGLWELLSQTRGHLNAGETILVNAPPLTPTPLPRGERGRGAPTPLPSGERGRGEGPLALELVTKTPSRHWLVRLAASPASASTTMDLLSRYGQIPLPPYIRKGRACDADCERYQTVYAHQAGAVAAPTAGLHFTPRLFERLKQRGIDWAFVTLHVGIGTFQPIQVEDVMQHQVHREWGELPAAAVAAIEACKARGGRVVAVGTTSVRVLETVAASGELRPWSGETELTIRPGFAFRVVDALVTNFHLPRSSLLMLVAAFTGLESLHEAYREAIVREYRFYSYGDAMLIL